MLNSVNCSVFIPPKNHYGKERSASATIDQWQQLPSNRIIPLSKPICSCSSICTSTTLVRKLSNITAHITNAAKYT